MFCLHVLYRPAGRSTLWIDLGEINSAADDTEFWIRSLNGYLIVVNFRGIETFITKRSFLDPRACVHANASRFERYRARVWFAHGHLDTWANT